MGTVFLYLKVKEFFMASNTQLEDLIARRNEIDEQIRELQRQSDGVIHICDGVDRRRDILFMDFAEFKANGVEFDYAFDIDDSGDEPEFYASCGTHYSCATDDNDTTIDAAINKVDHYYEAYKKLREFLLNMKNTGVKYIADSSDCEAADYDFEDEN